MIHFHYLWNHYLYNHIFRRNNMLKTEVKKYVKSLDKVSLVDLVMDMYMARKEVKLIYP